MRRPQDEPTIALNPLDRRNVVVGANDFRTWCDDNGEYARWAYVSNDGARRGRTSSCRG